MLDGVTLVVTAQCMAVLGKILIVAGMADTMINQPVRGGWSIIDNSFSHKVHFTRSSSSAHHEDKNLLQRPYCTSARVENACPRERSDTKFS